jgi:hypothetical protein
MQPAGPGDAVGIWRGVGTLGWGGVEVVGKREAGSVDFSPSLSHYPAWVREIVGYEA